MRVLFLTEQGEGIGYGHINRCIALADGFSFCDCSITIVSSGKKPESNFERSYDVLSKEWNDRSYLSGVLADFDITVVDSYLAGDSLLKFIGRNSNLPVYLIDSKMRFYQSGIILFPSIYADENKIKTTGASRIISGIDYLLFTKELWDVKKKYIGKAITSVGISMGGMTSTYVFEIVRVIKENIPPPIKVFVFGNVSGTDTKKLNKEGCIIKGFISKQEYVANLKEMDLMICNGGQSLNESLLLGIPVLSLICAENQRCNAESWQELGLTLNMDIQNNLDKKELRDKIQIIADFSKRNEINRKSRELINSGGAIRSAKKIIESDK